MLKSLENPRVDQRRWWVLTVVVAAQFMFVVDTFIVNVAIPAVRADLHANAGTMQAVLALYQIAYACLVITGGRIGDIYGRKAIFLLGLSGFTAASIWCGCARSGSELVLARVVQGAFAALMSPQVLATIHTLFPDPASRARAFGAFGMALGLGGGFGLVFGGWLVSFDLAGLGWRVIFFVNGPVGIGIALAAGRLLPDSARQPRSLDIAGAVLLFAAIAALVGTLLIGPASHWPWWLLIVASLGCALLVWFVQIERRIERRGGLPLLDLALLADPVFRCGLAAVCWLFGGNISFYLVLSLYLQHGLAASPLATGTAMLPMALAFMLGSRMAAGRADLGIPVLLRGCVVQLVGLLLLTAIIAIDGKPPLPLLATALMPFGFGQGCVMAPLFATVLTNVRSTHAGAGSGVLTTVQQIANGAGVASIGAAYDAMRSVSDGRFAMLLALALIACCVGLTRGSLMRLRRLVARAETSG